MTKMGEVQGTSVSVRADGILVLVVATKTGAMELEFTPEAWARLAESAKWFKDIGFPGELGDTRLSAEQLGMLANAK
jgi:hypothetical protein